MTAEEQLIVDFLQQSPANGFGRMEIARKAVHRKDFEENPRWADAPLNALLDRKVIVQDVSDVCSTAAARSTVLTSAAVDPARRTAVRATKKER